MNAPVDISHVRIETERLILRPWREDDLEDFYAYASVPDVGEMAGWPHHESREESERILKLFIRDKKTLALELKATGRVIGSLGIEELEPDPIGEGKLGRELGYVLSQDYWGLGLMPEAVEAVTRYCFDTLGYDYLTCCHFAGNVQSQRVIEKSGFAFLQEATFESMLGATFPTRLYIKYNPNKE